MCLETEECHLRAKRHLIKRLETTHGLNHWTDSAKKTRLVQN